MEFNWTRRPEFPKKHFCVLPVTFHLGNSKHEWTHTRIRRTVWMENLWWTPNDMADTFSCDGQIETTSGRFYQCGAIQWRKIKDRQYSYTFAWILIGTPLSITILYLFLKVA